MQAELMGLLTVVVLFVLRLVFPFCLTCALGWALRQIVSKPA